MTVSEARLIRHIKKNCTYRFLAEVYYPETEPGHGIQLYGEDLCKAAFNALFPTYNRWEYKEELNEDNKSNLGGFYWWE